MKTVVWQDVMEPPLQGNHSLIILTLSRPSIAVKAAQVAIIHFMQNAPKAIAMPQSSTLESDAMGAIIHLQIASRLIALNRTGS